MVITDAPDTLTITADDDSRQIFVEAFQCFNASGLPDSPFLILAYRILLSSCILQVSAILAFSPYPTIHLQQYVLQLVRIGVV